MEYNYDKTNPLYKGEAFTKDVKYSFEVYSYKGNGFYKWDTDNDDDTWEESSTWLLCFLRQ